MLVSALRRRWRAAVLAAAGGMLVGAAVFAGWVVSLGPAPLGEALEYSTLVVDRQGRLLRPYATADGRWRLRTDLASVDPRYVDALLAYEDKRFRSHRGVDALSVARAAWQLARNGRIVSGGSTLTMQVARLLEPRAERSFGA
ncbi:MAG: transglycosylase domain-containing protein, partial [Variibacter sp.]|nr:transglycosylase domain-containing protein [Variibacter sp.]